MDKIKVGIIGTGYVGLVSGACFANLGYETICLDVNENKINMINNGISPIYEHNLDELLNKVVLKEKLLYATNSRKKLVIDCDVIFICLPTPSNANGSIDLSFILNELKEIGSILKTCKNYKTIVIKSTVIPGSTMNNFLNTIEKFSSKRLGDDFGLIVNPEFLMEGSALNNFNNPDRIIIGYHDHRSKDIITSLYNSFNCPIIYVTFDEAEMIKYVSNSFLATKISFINEIANLSENFNINMDHIVEGVGLDQRISPNFFRSGLGFGGSCFPKDVNALYSLSKQYDSELTMLKATLSINDIQPLRAIDILTDIIDVTDKKVTILGLSFKPNTDDIREAPSLKIAKELHRLGSDIYAYDPIYVNKKINNYDYIKISNNYQDAIKNSYAVIIVTEWDEFKSLNSDDFEFMTHKLVIDGRRILDPKLFDNSLVRLITIGNSKNHQLN